MDTTLLARLLGARRTISPLAPVAAPQFDLARFRAGDEILGQVLQRFTDGAYKLLIDGKPARIALPTEHHPGEQVRLRVVSGRDGPRLTTVAEARPEASRVSGAGQLVTTLLRQTEDMPAPLRSAVLPSPTDDANEIAAPLARAVIRSGAFYESHLARWVSGEYPLDALREEPQALHHKTTNETPASHARPEQPLRSTLLQNAAVVLRDIDEQRDHIAPRPSSSPSDAPAKELVARDSLPHVRQQLDMLESRQFVWSGEIWPGQTLNWEIEDGGDGEQRPHEEKRWATRIGLTLASIGPVNAELELTGQGVRVTLAADDPATRAAMQSARPELHEKLVAAGLINPNIVIRDHDRIT